MNSLVSIFEKWLSKPFDPAGDAVDWVLFLGFAALVLFGWHRVIRKIATD